MKTNKNIVRIFSLLLLGATCFMSCETDDADLKPASFPADGSVFLDAFSGGLNYAAFGGSKVTAFDVVTDETYDGSDAAMKFEVPDFEDPAGAYAGGAFFTEVGRDLTKFNALTFYIKASKSATIDLVGFGNDLGASTYQTTIAGLPVTTNWKKVFIPIPDPAKLTQEKGMFFYSEGPEDERGYTFWIDEVKFEKIDELAYPNPIILNGQNQEITLETGDGFKIEGLSQEFNLPNGVNQRINITPGYFTFSSSNADVASVGTLGSGTVMTAGEAIITGSIAGKQASGSLKITSTGDPILPATKAPTPDKAEANVISMFSNAYTDVKVDTWNPFWEFSTTLVDDVQVDGDDIKRYKSLNFVGILTESEQIDATSMTHLHMNIWTPDSITASTVFNILLRDYGANGNFDAEGDDTSHELSIPSEQLATKEWISLDIPLASFSGLTNRGNIAQMVLSGGLPNVFVDNVYYYKEVIADNPPSAAAPAPTADAADVISIYSNAYTNLAETDFYPDWGQATQFKDTLIQDDNVIRYSSLNYQGIQLKNATDVSSTTTLHIDVWSTNLSTVDFFPISVGSGEKKVTLELEAGQWNSFDIALTEFTDQGLDLTDIHQFKFDAQPNSGTIYMDNLYFYTPPPPATAPDDAPTAPTAIESNVSSIYSNEYTNLAGINYFPDWGQATTYLDTMIAGNNVIRYANLNYQGVDLGTEIDGTTFDSVHISVWSGDMTNVDFFLINKTATGAEEKKVILELTPGQWNVFSFPLTQFTDQGMAVDRVFQLKFDAQIHTPGGTMFVDDLYFSKAPSMATAPEVAAQAPTADAASVTSIYSNAYTNLAGINYFPDWGQATTYLDTMIAGDNVIRYGNLNYQGIDFGTELDATAFDTVYIDVWSPDLATVDFFLINKTATGAEEKPVTLDLVAGQWNHFALPISQYSDQGMGVAQIFQFKLVGPADTAGTIFVDNIYFK